MDVTRADGMDVTRAERDLNPVGASSTPECRVDAAQLMQRFAARTAIAVPEGCRRRYLWTDAFAVCNFVGLVRATGSLRHLQHARMLVERVHESLGRHRPDDARTGWLAGSSGEDARRHPTRAGLRIGKPLPEREPAEQYDPDAEWQRDGQYFHYLTRWMHALARVAHAGGKARYLEWAIELALVAHRAFAFTRPNGRRSLHWKMSIDLRRPLVPSIGQHDPLDGLLTFMELRAAAVDAGHEVAAIAQLDAAIADLRAMTDGLDLATADALGIGGLLAGAHTLARLRAPGGADAVALLVRVLRAAESGLDAWRRRLPLALPPRHRLAFRELGLAIGLHAVADITSMHAAGAAFRGVAAVAEALGAFQRYASIADEIENCWRDPRNRDTESWTAHMDINDVMLATALLPDGYLDV